MAVGRGQEPTPTSSFMGFGAWEVFDRTLADGTELDVGTRAWAAHIEGALEEVVAAIASEAPSASLLLPDVPCFEEQDLALGDPPSPRDDPARSKR